MAKGKKFNDVVGTLQVSHISHTRGATEVHTVLLQTAPPAPGAAPNPNPFGGSLTVPVDRETADALNHGDIVEIVIRPAKSE